MLNKKELEEKRRSKRVQLKALEPMCNWTTSEFTCSEKDLFMRRQWHHITNNLLELQHLLAKIG
jgi:hypothetical protein